MARVLRFLLGNKSQPDVLVGLLVIDLAWNAFMPKQWLESHEDRIGIEPALRPWLTPIKSAAAVGLLLGKRWPKLGALTAAGCTAYFGIAMRYHRRAGDSLIGTSPAVIYGGASVRSLYAFVRS